MRYALILSLLVLAACAQGVRWTKAGISEGQAEYEYKNCRRQANKQVESEGDFRYLSDSSDPLAAYDRDQAEQKVERYTAKCMTDKGYAKKTG